MFRVDWVEAYLSRVRPWQVLAVWVPVSLWFGLRAVRAPGVGLVGALLLFLGGLFAWTLLEYIVHRWVFHFLPDSGSELQRDLSFLIHGVHHDWPYDPDRLVMPPVVSLPIAIVIGLSIRTVMGPRLFPGLFSGLIAGYLWYDMTHYAVHHLKQRTAFGKLQRRNHLTHHFTQPEARYGVTTPLWDIVFGTHPASTQPARGGRARPPEAEAEGS